MDDVVLVLTIVSIIGCGVVGGVFFAFSTFVMPALGRLPAAQGIAAMQAINVAAITPLFMAALFGTAAACAALVVCLVVAWGGAAAAYGIAGAVAYLVGNIVVTIAFNVPRNDALAQVEAASDEGAALWSDYLQSWSAWNHVRTVTGVAASALLTVALVVD